MPAAGRTTKPRIGAQWAIDQLADLGRLGVTYDAIRERRAGLGRELSDATGVGPDAPEAITALPMAQRNRLRTAVLERLSLLKGRSA